MYKRQAVISYELHEHAPDTPEMLVYLLVGIGAFMGAFLLDELISRIPIPVSYTHLHTISIGVSPYAYL